MRRLLICVRFAMRIFLQELHFRLLLLGYVDRQPRTCAPNYRGNDHGFGVRMELQMLHYMFGNQTTETIATSLTY